MIPSSIVWNSIQVTIVCALAVIVSWACRGRYPQWVSSILVGTIFGSLLLSIAIFVPQSRWSIGLDQTATQIATDTTAVASTPSSSNLQRQGKSTTPATTVLDTNTIQGDGKSPALATTRFTQAFREWLGQSFHWIDHRVEALREQPAAPTWSVLGGMRATMLCLLVVCVGLWGVSLYWMRQVVRTSVPVDDTDLQELVSVYSKRLGIRSVPELRSTGTIHIGATVGFYRCHLLLNTDWRSWKPIELQSVVAHELAHIARFDFVWSMLSSLFRMFYFFHPMAYYLVRRLRLEQELAADQIAAGLVGDAKAYGRALAGLAIRGHDRRWASSPVLMASNFDLLRRIMMLKQGRLKPNVIRRRWTKVLLLTTAIAVLPFSGLRGTPPQEEPISSAKSEVRIETSVSESDSAKGAQSEHPKVGPQLRFSGASLYRPGMFQPDNVSPVACWCAAYLNSIILDQTPSLKSELVGSAELIMQFEDAKKEHGRLSFGMALSQAKDFEPGTSTQLITGAKIPGMPNPTLVEELVIDGHQVKGYALEMVGASDGERVVPKQASTWIVDDEVGCFRGSLEEVKNFLKVANLPEADKTPAPFESCQDAVCAFVFENCHLWKEEFRKHIQGSPKALEMNMVTPLLDGLVQCQASLKADRSESFVVEARYESAKQATAAKDLLAALLQMGIASVASEPDADQLAKLLATLVIEQQDNVLTMPVHTDFILYALEPDQKTRDGKSSIAGWECLLNSGFNQSSEGVVLAHEQTTSSIPARLVQNIDATPYRNQRVRFRATSTITEEDSAQATIELWTSGDRAKSLGYSVGSLSSGIEVDVAEDATVLSYGVAAKEVANGLTIRACSLEVVGPATGAPSQRPPHAVNWYARPGCKIYSKPTNMDFHESNEAAPQQVAEQP
jgi:beta-lactamase regulating signal transducer with metallopeptidase domain